MFGVGDSFGGFGGGGRPSVGGGGFLPGSDGWGDSQGTGNSIARQTGSGQSQTCMPLKAAMIHRAQAANPADYRLIVLGNEVEYFKLVGFVKEYSPDDGQKIAFALDDGSSTIRVEWYIAWLFESGMTKMRQQKINAIGNDIWVAVYGEVNLLGKMEPHVKASMIRVVENYNEVFYHDIDVAYNIAKIVYPKTGSSDNTGATGEQSLPTPQSNQRSGNVNQTAYGAAVHGSENTESATKKLDPASRKVYEILHAFTPQRTAGVGIHELLMRIRNSGYPDYTEVHLRSALDLLSMEGFAFFSSDMDHWKSLIVDSTIR